LKALTVVGFTFSVFDFAPFDSSDFFEPFAGSIGSIAFDFRSNRLSRKVSHRKWILTFPFRDPTDFKPPVVFTELGFATGLLVDP
jgi:hypothetical protein